MFDFYMNTKVKFGCGVRKSIPDTLQAERWKRIGIVIDHSLTTLPVIGELLDKLKESTERLVIGECRISEPTYDALEDVRTKFADPSLQAVIGVGGGSALDMAKAMAVLVHNTEPAITYRGFDKMTEPVLPVIAVPTTAGTGSEVTPNASFIDAAAKKKMGINGEAVRPRFAFLDPELTVSCPKAPTVSAAVDSLVHATEAYAAKKTNPFARFFAAEGFQRVFLSLPRLMADMENRSLREEVMYGAFLSGIALMHSGTGPAAAMSYPLGVHYKVPHGIGGGIFLPHVMKYNIANGYKDYSGLYEKVGSVSCAEEFPSAVMKLWEELDVPRKLAFCGLDKSGIDSFIQDTLELKGALDQNPVPFGKDEIRNIVELFVE